MYSWFVNSDCFDSVLNIISVLLYYIANNNIPVEDLAEVNNIVGIDLNHHQFPANNNLGNYF